MLWRWFAIGAVSAGCALACGGDDDDNGGASGGSAGSSGSGGSAAEGGSGNSGGSGGSGNSGGSGGSGNSGGSGGSGASSGSGGSGGIGNASGSGGSAGAGGSDCSTTAVEQVATYTEAFVAEVDANQFELASACAALATGLGGRGVPDFPPGSDVTDSEVLEVCEQAAAELEALLESGTTAGGSGGGCLEPSPAACPGADPDAQFACILDARFAALETCTAPIFITNSSDSEVLRAINNQLPTIALVLESFELLNEIGMLLAERSQELVISVSDNAACGEEIAALAQAVAVLAPANLSLNVQAQAAAAVLAPLEP